MEGKRGEEEKGECLKQTGTDSQNGRKKRGRRERGMFNTDSNGFTKWKEKEGKKRKGNV